MKRIIRMGRRCVSLRSNRFFMNRLYCRVAVGILVILMAGCEGTHKDADVAQIRAAHVNLPEYPFQEDSGITIDTELLDDLALDFLRGGGGKEELAEFLFSHVPVWSFDGMTGKDFSRMETLEGLLYLSGFFGGVWLKGVLAPGIFLVKDSPEWKKSSLTNLTKGIEDTLFSVLAALASNLNDQVLSGDAESLNRFLQNSMNFLIFLYGYNLGYLQSILDHPPEGVTPPVGYLVCDHFLDCVTPVQGLSILEDLLPLVEHLKDPPDSRWEQMKNKVETDGPAAVERGYDVWSDHLSVEDMLSEDYEVLLDLSAGFLLYCQVLVLASMDAWVMENEDAARTAVALSAGMTAWVGGYGIGLVSSFPADHLPSIEIEY